MEVRRPGLPSITSISAAAWASPTTDPGAAGAGLRRDRAGGSAADTGLPLILEPGRAIVGASGVLVERVVDVKMQPGGKPFVVLDTGMTELIRPTLYGAFHRIDPVRPWGHATTVVDVVGPLCESSDTVGADREMVLPQSTT